MSRVISVNEVKNSAFLANQSYESFPNSREVTNPATNSSFEVIDQKKEITTALLLC